MYVTLVEGPALDAALLGLLSACGPARSTSVMMPPPPPSRSWRLRKEWERDEVEVAVCCGHVAVPVPALSEPVEIGGQSGQA